MIIFGGQWGLTYYNDGGIYDPRNGSGGSWTHILGSSNASNNGSSNFTLAWTGSKLFMFGGDQTYSGGSYPPNNFAGFWDSLNNNWNQITTASATPPPSAGQIATWSGSQVLLYGGTLATNSKAWAYDPKTSSWSQITTTIDSSLSTYPQGAWTGQTWLLSDGHISYKLNPTATAWTALTTNTQISARSGHNLIWTGRELIIFGGNDGSDHNDLWIMR